MFRLKLITAPAFLMSPEGDAGNGGGQGGQGSGETGSGAGGQGSGQGSSGTGEGGGTGGAGNGGGSSSGNGEGDWTPPARSEWDNVQRRLRETSTELSRLREADTAAKREGGQFEDLYKEADTARQTAEGRVAELEAKLLDLERGGTARSMAGDLNFRRPEAAIRLLPAGTLSKSDGEVRSALEALAREMPELVSGTGERRTGDVTGDPSGGSQSMNDLLRRGAGRGV